MPIHKTFPAVCLLNITGSFAYLFFCIRNYYLYLQMPGVLHAESFIVMAVLELVIIGGLALMLLRRRKGFYVYIVGQLLSYLYPIVTDTGDTVWGLLALPLVLLPMAAGYFYYKNLQWLEK